MVSHIAEAAMLRARMPALLASRSRLSATFCFRADFPDPQDLRDMTVKCRSENDGHDIIQVIMTAVDICPRCGSATLKSWDDLDRDEKIVAERLPRSREGSGESRKKHRFCTRCWYESLDTNERA